MRSLLIAALACLGGLVVAYVDSQPRWDDTGVTAVTLGVLAGAASYAAGNRPWLWALLVAGPLVVLEVTRRGDVAPLMALAFAAIGAVGGWALARRRSHENRAGSPR